MNSIGDMRERVKLYRRDADITGGNGSVGYALLGSYAAEVYDRSDKVFSAGSGEYVESLIFVNLRTPRHYRPAPLMQLEWRGDLYEVIEAPPDKPMRGFTRLRCRLIKMGGDGVDRH